MIYIVLALIFLAAVVRWDTPATAIVSRSGRTTDDPTLVAIIRLMMLGSIRAPSPPTPSPSTAF